MPARESSTQRMKDGKRTVDKGQNEMKIFSSMAVLLVLVLPLIMVSLPGVPTRLGRGAATSLLVFLVPLGFFWFGFSSKSRVIGRSGKLNEPRFDKVRPQVERGIRIFVVAFGFFFSFVFTLPFGSDLFHLVVGEKPAIITGIPIYKSVPLGGLWFLKQSVSFKRDAASTYYLFYSWTPLRVGRSYEFVVLPRSRVILDFHESGTMQYQSQSHDQQ